MWEFIKWFIIIDLLGWVIYPNTYFLLKNLNDRGITVSKVLGLLIWGYLFWLFNIFGLISNSSSGAFFVFVLIAFTTIIIQQEKLREILGFLKSNFYIVLFYEILFLLSFSFCAFLRSLNSGIIGTEKPMELAFINAIYRSPAFPPNDPWLSGYAISYYYFGYLLVTMLMHICATASGIAFNLAVALWFALIATASAGLLYNLLSSSYRNNSQTKKKIFLFLWLSLIAPLMILFISNAEGFLEVLHAKGVFWEFDKDNVATSRFWQWLDIQELSQPPALPLSWQPNRAGGTWWWRASRVLQDYDMGGSPREIIDEFPFFSFYLADFHPHVISIPFVCLVLAWGFSLLKRPEDASYTKISLLKGDIWITGFLCGSLIFINTWDFPIYAGFLVVLYGVKQFLLKREAAFPLKEPICFGISFGIASILLYLPFLLGLSSQAGGFLPSLIFRTRGIHFFVMFFVQIILISWYLIRLIRNENHASMLKYLLISITICGAIFGISLLYIFLFANIPKIIGVIGNFFNIDTSSLMVKWQMSLQSLMSIYGSQNAGTLISNSIKSFVSNPTVILFLSLWVAMIITYIHSTKRKQFHDGEQLVISKSNITVVVMVFIGLLLCLVPEFFYLRDQFGWRMNTIFKFYFQAWIMFSIAASFYVATKIIEISSARQKIFFYGVLSLILLIGLAYPYCALRERLHWSTSHEITLDGDFYFKDAFPAEYDAILFLREAPYGIIAEAIGGSYSNYARVSRLTGLPTVLGWPGHELQWRGGTKEIGSRESDIHLLYTTNDWDVALKIIDKYNIDYIYIGPLERSSYAISEGKFSNYLKIIYQTPEVSIYATYPQINDFING